MKAPAVLVGLCVSPAQTRSYPLPAMKTNLAPRFLKTAVLVVLLSTLTSQLSTFAQGTAFTYQGRLNENTSPATGAYDLQFSLYDAASNGNAIGGPVTNAATSV